MADFWGRFRRRRDDDSPPAAAPERPHDAWRELAPITPAVTSTLTGAGVSDPAFPDSLPTRWATPPALGRLAHDVMPEAASGLVEGLVRPITTLDAALPDGMDELPLAVPAAVAGAERLVPRSVAASAPAPLASAAPLPAPARRLTEPLASLEPIEPLAPVARPATRQNDVGPSAPIPDRIAAAPAPAGPRPPLVPDWVPTDSPVITLPALQPGPDEPPRVEPAARAIAYPTPDTQGEADEDGLPPAPVAGAPVRRRPRGGRPPVAPEPAPAPAQNGDDVGPSGDRAERVVAPVVRRASSARTDDDSGPIIARPGADATPQARPHRPTEDAERPRSAVGQQDDPGPDDAASASTAHRLGGDLTEPERRRRQAEDEEPVRVIGAQAATTTPAATAHRLGGDLTEPERRRRQAEDEEPVHVIGAQAATTTPAATAHRLGGDLRTQDRERRRAEDELPVRLVGAEHMAAMRGEFRDTEPRAAEQAAADATETAAPPRVPPVMPSMPEVAEPPASIRTPAAAAAGSGPPALTPTATGVDAAAAEDDPAALDRLAGQLFGRLRHRIANELLVGRERSSLLTDLD